MSSTRLALAAAAGLVPVWAKATRGATGYRFIVGTCAGAAFAAGLGVWVRRRTAEERLSLRIDARSAASGVAVGLAQVAVVHAGTVVLRRLAPPIVEAMTRVSAEVDDVPLPARVALSGGIVAPLEEFFWRGAVHRPLDPHGPPLRRAALSTLLFTAFQFTTGRPVLTLAALAGGAGWSLLAEVHDSAAPAIVAHVTWTTVILLLPPVGR